MVIMLARGFEHINLEAMIGDALPALQQSCQGAIKQARLLSTT